MKTGDSFGDYKVIRLLGRGGMGEVWLLEGKSGRQVAAKILEATADHEARKRFLREAQLALGVKHPNLVETFDVGEDPESGLCYILMEYVSGGTLADYIKSHGALAIEDAVAVVEAIAGVLELGRQKGIVHRDIKPANIMFDAVGTPKLADLGIARAGAGTETTTVTQTGMMIGTPAYMSPEQMLDSHNVDTRADIYSLGVVFFEMLTGQRPNKDDTVVQLMAKAVKGEPLPDVRTLRPEVSASLAQLLNMMVAPDKNGRISTPGQITNALAIIERGGEFAARGGEGARRPTTATGAGRAVAPRPPDSPPAGFPKWLVPVLVLAALAGLFYVLAPKKDRAMPPAAKVVTREMVQTNVVKRVVARTNTIERVVKTKVAVPSANPVKLPDGAYTEERSEGEWSFVVRDGKLWLGDGEHPALYPQPEGKLRLPSSFRGMPVAGVSRVAFRGSRALAELDVPEGYETIGDAAFYDCVSLVRATLPKSLRSIRNCAFCWTKIRSLDMNRIQDWDAGAIAGMRFLEEITFDARNRQFVTKDGCLFDREMKRFLFLPRSRTDVTIPPGIERIDARAFEGCAIRQLVVPKGVRHLGHLVCSCCPELQKIVLPDRELKIDGQAFEQAEKLTELKFGEGIKHLDEWAVFTHCSSLRKLKLPDSLETMGAGTFEHNTSLEEIHFGRSLRRIGYRSFGGDISLKSVRLPLSLCEMVAECFKDCNSLRVVRFDGDAPMLIDEGNQRGVDIFMGTPRDLVVYVKRGSKGWNPNGEGLPDRWPVGAGGNARKIQYIDDRGAREDTSTKATQATAGEDAKRVDAAKLKDDDATRATQKSFDALFPGWKVSAVEQSTTDWAFGYQKNWRGRCDVVTTMPASGEKPCVLSRKVKVTGSHPVLLIEVASQNWDTDFLLTVRVNRKTMLGPRLVCTPDDAPYERIQVPLSQWKGREVVIEVEHCCNGWYFEHAFWGRLEIVEGTGKETCGPVGIASTEVFPRVNFKNKKWMKRAPWAYTTHEPPANWKDADFDDSSWKRTKKALGFDKGPMMDVADEWHADRVWIRRKFNWLSVKPFYKAVFDLCYDQDIEIYLNGICISKMDGWNESWIPYAAWSLRVAETLRKGENILAITLKGDGASYFDCGLTIETRSQAAGSGQ